MVSEFEQQELEKLIDQYLFEAFRALEVQTFDSGIIRDRISRIVKDWCKFNRAKHLQNAQS